MRDKWKLSNKINSKDNEEIFYMNSAELYSITEDNYENDIFLPFDKAPIYKKRSLVPEKEIFDIVEKTKSSEGFSDLVKMNKYIINIKDGIIFISSNPILYKFKTNNFIYADCYYSFKLIINTTDDFFTVFYNYHSFEGNEDYLDYHFFVENASIYSLDYSPVKSLENILLDPTGEVISEDINVDTITYIVWSLYSSLEELEKYLWGEDDE